jgi:hypothetical protein
MKGVSRWITNVISAVLNGVRAYLPKKSEKPVDAPAPDVKSPCSQSSQASQEKAAISKSENPDIEYQKEPPK